jgi:hypothetical protein
MINTRIIRILGVALLTACASSENGSGVPTTMHPTIILTNETVAASMAPSGPSVSILDSIDVRVTAENGAKSSIGRHLSRYNTTATFQLAFPQGNTVFTAEVLSNTRVSVFSGTTTQLITSDILSLPIKLTATKPVLMMVPDTAKTNTVTSTQFTVYNAGVGTLAWNVASMDTAFTRCGPQCTISPTSGSVAPGTTQTVRVTVPINFPSRTFAFGIKSAEGNVTVNWQYSASAVTGVTISPTASLHNLAQAFTLTPTVQSSGTGTSSVGWSSSNSNVATVNVNGVVTGVSRGVATVTARSVVDTAKHATADIRVYDSTSTNASWALVQSATPDTIRRDDTSADSRSTLVLTAQASGSGAAPFTAVEFWVRPGSIGPWRRIGTSTSAASSTDAGGQVWSWSYTWNPDATDAPFINPSTTGMSVIAIGITSNGSTQGTPVNHDVYVRVP